ncbi:hypothetical protein YH65_04690 [Sulfurovum lithotrophicum]|uniref:LPS export ABC transporter periplasmic protein LptC n=1 Tax=Sulfurovum lithotrophicum TaxID=206403 RepID=A0A7U4M0S7_9BACT|nr:hypothetical protein [Sulfurovum lithotrophicum]AKF24760.1 hypothetical protein YH65_04690 [Sulfurovum lithotrophicum]
MGLKLELLLGILIVVMLAIAYNVKLVDDVTTKERSRKEMEFTDTTFTEVDTKRLLSVLFSTHGTRQKGILSVDNVIYHSDTIELLLADKGRYFADKAYLDGNISVKQKEGFNYYAEHVIYDKKTEILTITSTFTALMDKNTIHGNTGWYDTRKKILFAKKIHAVVYTAEK